MGIKQGLLRYVKNAGYIAVSVWLAAITTLGGVVSTQVAHAYSGGGTGASGDPYLITSCNEFKQIDGAPSAYYSITQDLSCAVEGNSMIQANMFNGNLEGNNHTITIALTANVDYLGLFINMNDATISNLTLAGTVDNGNADGYGAIGKLAGSVAGTTHITNVTSSVDVIGKASNMGGLAGVAANNVIVTDTTVSGDVTNNTGNIGGFFGASYCGVSVSDSTYSGNVSGNGDQAGGITGFDGCEGPGGFYTNVTVTGDVVTDGGYVGGIVGQAWSTTVTGAHSSGYIEGIQHVGGIVGYAEFGTSISQSYSTGLIQAFGNNSGGIAGILQNSSSVSQSYSTSSINSYANYAGGLVGYVDSGASISNSYARGAVTGSAVGGLVGCYNSGSIQFSYATGSLDTSSEVFGGITGCNNNDTPNGLFWDTESSGVDVSELGTGKTTAEMKDIATYTNVATTGLGLSVWDFTGTPNNDEGADEIWSIYSTANDGYPCLNWQQDCRNAPSSPDSDGDGVSDAVEDAGPNGGDANNDGVADKTQDSVVAIFNDATQKYGVLELSQSCEIQTSEFGAASALPKADSEYVYPNGMFDFTADCGGTGQTFNVKQYYYNVDPTNFVVRKYNTNTHTYSTVTGAVIGRETIGGTSVVTASYQVTDGGELDMDGSANGVIHDPAGIATTVALAQTGEGTVFLFMIATTVLLAGSGLIFALRRSMFA